MTPQILGTTVKYLVAPATWGPEFVHPWSIMPFSPKYWHLAKYQKRYSSGFAKMRIL
jgi:hypothetical protein